MVNKSKILSDLSKIAVDAMGGENSPNKIIQGIEISLKKNKENYFYLFGDKKILNKEIKYNSEFAFPLFYF